MNVTMKKSDSLVIMHAFSEWTITELNNKPVEIIVRNTCTCSSRVTDYTAFSRFLMVLHWWESVIIRKWKLALSLLLWDIVDLGQTKTKQIKQNWNHNVVLTIASRVLLALDNLYYKNSSDCSVSQSVRWHFRFERNFPYFRKSLMFSFFYRFEHIQTLFLIDSNHYHI